MPPSSDTQIVILAGGLGARLRPITETCPKPMVPVAGQPFLHWQLEDLKSQGFSRVLLLVSYLGEQIESHFGKGERFGLKIEYSFERQPLGTGGALKHARQKLDEEFILLNGDSFLRAPLAKMFESFRREKVSAMVSVYDNREPVPVIPNLKVDGARVLDYKKDAGLGEGFQLIDSGIYVIKRVVLDPVQSERFMLSELWPPLIASGGFGAYFVDERFYDIGTSERLKEFEEKVRDYFPHTLSR